MAAVLIKQIYSIVLLQLYQRGSGAPHLQRRVPTACLGHTLPAPHGFARASNGPAGMGQRCRRQQWAKSSSEQGLCSLIFQKCWEVWKVTENLSSLSLTDITRAVKVLTITIKIYYSIPDFNWTLLKRHTNRTWVCPDQVPPTAQVNFYSD